MRVRDGKKRIRLIRREREEPAHYIRRDAIAQDCSCGVVNVVYEIG